MSDLPKISIIIPVYNGEEYIERCLDSISKQSYENIEIIIINDGSTDNTQLICDGYLEKECRARVVSKENEGVSVARNAGLDLAVGDYIYFADADDYVLQDGIKNLVNKVDETAADLIVAEYYVADRFNESKVSPLVTNDRDGFLCSILTGRNHSALWNKLFKRKLFDKVRFIENICYMEDRVLIVDILIFCQPKISFLDFPVYVYWQDENSITGSKDKRILKIFNAHILVAKKINKHVSNADVIRGFSFGAFKSIFFVLRNVDYKFIHYSVISASSFYYELTALGFWSPRKIYRNLFSVFFCLPNVFKVWLIKIIRYLV